VLIKCLYEMHSSKIKMILNKEFLGRKKYALELDREKFRI